MVRLFLEIDLGAADLAQVPHRETVLLPLKVG
jgi:hypothetical protein